MKAPSWNLGRLGLGGRRLRLAWCLLSSIALIAWGIGLPGRLTSVWYWLLLPGILWNIRSGWRGWKYATCSLRQHGVRTPI